MFPNRALIIAPVGRDLSLEHPHTVRIPGASNGVKQGWDTLDQDYWQALADPALQGYGTFAAVPLALKKYLVQVLRYDDAAGTVNPRLVRLVDCTAADFIVVRRAGAPVVIAATAILAGDRPLEWEPVHRWLGDPAETLGSP